MDKMKLKTLKYLAIDLAKRLDLTLAPPISIAIE